MDQKMILTLLGREWFQRIWVVQEVAAARHILIKSGSTEIDGYAFGELVDMYHTRKATNPLDKVYALLGMSSNDPGIKADYESSWKYLFRELVNFSLSNPVSVRTWDAKEASVMEANGYILGEVSSAREDATRDDREHVEITGKTAPSHSDAEGEQSSHSAIQASAKTIEKGDIVEVAVIEAKGYVLGEVSSAGEDVEITWKTAAGHSDAKGEPSSRFDFQASAKAIKKGDIVCLLEEVDKKALGIMDSPLFKDKGAAMEAKYTEHGQTPLRWALEEGHGAVVKLLAENGANVDAKNEGGQTPLSWAAEKGHKAAVELLLATGKADVDAKDNNGRTPLSWAAWKGHEAIVERLLATGRADVDAKDSDGRTPLSRAAEKGHKAVVERLKPPTPAMERKSHQRNASGPLIPAFARLRLEANPQAIPRSVSSGSIVGQLQLQRQQLAGPPTRPTSTNNLPQGPRPDGEDDSVEVRRWRLSAQNPGGEVQSFTKDPNKLFQLPRGLQVDYPQAVVDRRPMWIASYGLEANSRVHDYLFPACNGPRGRIGQYFDTPWHDISLALYDIEGMIMQQDWLTFDLILHALKFILAPYEHCVWIYPNAVTDQHPPAGPARRRQKQVAATKRFWVLPCHRYGNHWAVAIYDQVTTDLFFFDSLPRPSKDDHMPFMHKVLDVVTGSAEIPPLNGQVKGRVVVCPRQKEGWECGLWVLEFTRFFFQEMRGEDGVRHPLRWMQGRLYKEYGNLGKAQDKMLRCWTNLIREVLGSTPPSAGAAYPPLHPPIPTASLAYGKQTQDAGPLSIQALDLQPHTNASVLSTLLREENIVLELGDEGASQLTALTEKMLLGALASSDPEIRVVLDVGAQIVESSNFQMAKSLLDNAPTSSTDAAIFFNDNDELSVLTRNGVVDSFLTSPFAAHTDRCLVFLDQAHTRGTDLKLPDNYRAAVTLGPGVTKDTLVQACMRMRKLGQGQSVSFIVSPEMQKRIRGLRNITDGRPLAVPDVLAWAISEAWDETVRSVPLWATQGVRHLRQEAIWKETDTTGGFTRSSVKAYLEPDAMSLEQRYSPGPATTHDTITTLMASLNLDAEPSPEDNELAAIKTKLLAFKCSTRTSSSTSPTLQEEQERELAPEIEQERQVCRPPPRKARAHNLHADVVLLARTGTIRAGSSAFVPAFTTLSTTSAAALFADDLSAFPTDLLATRDFTLAVEFSQKRNDTDPYLYDAHQRPVQWLLLTRPSTDPDHPQTMVIISPHEAALLKPTLASSTSPVSLHAYHPRLTLSHRTMEHLNTYTVPACASTWPTPPDSLITQLNLFAGQLYLRNYAEYVRMCRYLGLSYTKNSGEGEEKNEEVKGEKEEKVKGEKKEKAQEEKEEEVREVKEEKEEEEQEGKGEIEAKLETGLDVL
ncbi:hypothetical protein NEMBOFW57_006250 [Staphylotrichum longicolle]|uniref:ubiquitinyl hydrolase 1 n=1 Tax=Staphylotrichum longicolle TaxID=669026 RepID=A0AAD4EY60_9PEZI|nr:hypothetical protein NEMBOFW57_006250 [Staphylotrichum longicolle]